MTRQYCERVSSTRTLRLDLADDAKVEGDETLVVSFQVVSLGGGIIEHTQEATLTIANDDGPRSNAAATMATGPALSAADAQAKGRCRRGASTLIRPRAMRSSRRFSSPHAHVGVSPFHGSRGRSGISRSNTDRAVASGRHWKPGLSSALMSH